MLTTAIRRSLDDLIGLLAQLSDREYAQPCAELSQASIGQHTRHVIEMFQCLENHYELGTINYDRRERNLLIQTSTDFASKAIRQIKSRLGRPDKILQLQQNIDGQEITVESNYLREQLYNLEHCIHHQALIKVGLFQCAKVTVDENFGVASSTVEYRNQCAQ